MNVSSQIKNRIDKASLGEVFVISDFIDVCNYDTARKTLSRLEKKGFITNIKRGLYYKAKYSKLLKEIISPDINEIAKAIARNYGWTITPSGESALNQLGLSTQVPGRYSYISSGPYKNYKIKNTKIEFLHRADKDLNNKSYKTRLIIQAIKSIGKNQIGNYIYKFKQKLSEKEKETLLKEGWHSTAWIYDTIKKISLEK